MNPFDDLHRFHDLVIATHDTEVRAAKMKGFFIGVFTVMIIGGLILPIYLVLP